MSTPRPGRFTPDKDAVTIVQEAGWAQGRSGRVRKFSSPPEFDPRTVQPVAQSLYRLRYRDPHLVSITNLIAAYNTGILNMTSTGAQKVTCRMSLIFMFIAENKVLLPEPRYGHVA